MADKRMSFLGIKVKKDTQTEKNDRKKSFQRILCWLKPMVKGYNKPIYEKKIKDEQAVAFKILMFIKSICYGFILKQHRLQGILCYF